MPNKFRTHSWQLLKLPPVIFANFAPINSGWKGPVKFYDKMLYDNPALRFKDTNKDCLGEVAWRSPSNIALVKYWGKKGIQIPANPSISFSLSKSCTETRLGFREAKGKDFSVKFSLDGIQQPDFEKKIFTYFKSLTKIFPFIEQLDFEIQSKNTFPHSAGIASSASGMSALALALCDIERHCFNRLENEEDFFKKASFVARLGSGSAARSTYGGWVVWGEMQGMEGSSDLYAIPIKNHIHTDFLNYQDTILLVETGKKKVSSRVGHGLMNSNPFSKERFLQAHQNAKHLAKILKTGDIEAFINLSELEALTLHAMMMTSQPSFILMKPQTIHIIEEVRAYRRETGIPVCFTLDAGPNIHLLYPKSFKKKVAEFVENELKPYLNENGFIEDEMGPGPRKLV